MQNSAVRVPAFALTLVLALAAGVRAADDEPVPAEGDQPRPAPAVEVQPVRGVRYRVWLKSGRSMEGVVRAKGVFEAPASDGGYRPADEDEKGAGVRFWFPQAQDGFIFMPISAIGRLEELGELSGDEGRNIARARVEAAHRAERERFQIKERHAAEEAAARAAADAQRAADEAAAAEAAEEPAAEEPPDPDSDAGRMAALLLKFPPTRWTLDSPKEIERRKVILGLFPSDDEKAFLAAFDEWKVAYQAWAEAEAANQKDDADADKPAETNQDERSKKSRRPRER